MASVQANGITIEYAEGGNKNAPAILLTMGLGMQLIAWPDDFCDALAKRGFRVIRFDNRDTGLSTKMESAGRADVAAAFGQVMAGKPVNAAYLLRDMAKDALGLLDALGIKTAHLVGVSMGGMISQIVAAEAPERATSLTSIMSSSGAPGLPQGKPEATALLLAPRPDPNDREAVISQSMNVMRVVGSPGFPTDETSRRARAERAVDRAYYPDGVGRHLLAILASGSRADLLKTIRVPTLVIHGADDPLVPVEAGKDTAARVPGARLKIIPGMGHDLAPGLIPVLVDAIVEHCEAATRQPASTAA